MKTALFTIVSNNYLAYARTLMASAARIHPEWDRHVLLVDRPLPDHPERCELFETTIAEELDLPDSRRFLFRYGIMELNTAVKPWMFSRLMDAGYTQVVYLDPDIWIVSRLDSLERIFGEGSSGVLTPHLCAPIRDSEKPSEVDIMRCGAYNLGFLALRNSAEARRFVEWWQEKLEFGAAVDLSAGLFTDQKWLDLAPGMFDGFSILRDPGYNVAYWNLMHRKVEKRAGEWFANESPLRFFHFSGLDPRNPRPFSKHQNRFTLDGIGEAAPLVLEYSAAVLAQGHESLRASPYAYGRFSDGRAIVDMLRSKYRSDSDLQRRAGGDPFSRPDVFMAIDGNGNGALLDALWEGRKDLQRAFPLPSGADRARYLRWFVNGGALQAGLDSGWVESVRCCLEQTRSAGATASEVVVAVRGAPWGDRLEKLHWRLRGRGPTPEDLAAYHRVRSAGGFISLGFGKLVAYGRRHGWNVMMQAVAKLVPHYSWGDTGHGNVRRASEGSVSTPARDVAMVAGSFGGLGVYSGAAGEPTWASPAFRLRAPAGVIVEIKGVHPGVLFHRAHGSTEQTLIATSSGGLPIGRFRIGAPGPFCWSFVVPTLPASTPEGGCTVEIEITAERCFCPRDIELNDDHRELTFQLTEIVCDGVVLFPAPIAASTGASRISEPLHANLIGYIRSEHGVGQSARAFAQAAAAAKIELAVVDFNLGNPSRCEDSTLAARLCESPAHEINIIHVNADQIPVLWATKRDWLKNRRNIGFWHWELPEFPDRYLSAFQAVDEVWVSSAFVQAAVAQKSPVPVIKIPHAIAMDPIPRGSRTELGLPTDRFLFLMMYDFSSYQERKNPQAVLAAFDAAFAAMDGDVGLVVKTQNSAAHPEARAMLQGWMKGRGNCYWIDRTFSREQTYGLVNVCDCYVSLHRSEGFGLGPAEAMYLGKPVIATGWSGNMEFMNVANSCPVDFRLVEIKEDVGVYEKGNVWADPDVEDAARYMRALVNEGNYRSRISKRAAEYMREFHSPMVIGRRIRDRLESLATTCR